MTVRYPALYRLLSRLIARRDPGSPLRQRVLRREYLSGWRAATRGDFESMLTRYRPDVTYEFGAELVTLGLPPRIQGAEEWVRALTEFRESWSDWRFTLDYLIDCGDRALSLGRSWYRAASGGPAIEIEYAQLIHFDGMLVASERDFTHWGDALSACGLEPALRGRLERLAPGEVAAL